jgi:cell division protein FtsN
MDRMRNAPARRPAPRVGRVRDRARGGTLLGVFIGLVLGILLAGFVTIYVTGGLGVYTQQLRGRDAQQGAREPAKAAKADADRPKFDFYRILPGAEEPKVTPAKPASPDRAVADKAAEKVTDKSAARGAEPAAGDGKVAERLAAAEPAARSPAADRFWLQAGSFAAESDAENLKARLALAGWEAQVQQGTVPDKGTRYRVRLGPYDNTDELNRVKGELARRGFDVAVIRY